MPLSYHSGLLTAIRLATTWPIAHQILSRVRRYWCLPGMNSMNKVPSTGKFPPTPKPMSEMKKQREPKFGAEPETRPKIPPMTRVAFQATRRLISAVVQRSSSIQTHPTTSADVPQKEAPTIRPAYKASVTSLTSGARSSFAMAGRRMAIPCSHRLSANQPKPAGLALL